MEERDHLSPITKTSTQSQSSLSYTHTQIIKHYLYSFATLPIAVSLVTSLMVVATESGKGTVIPVCPACSDIGFTDRLQNRKSMEGVGGLCRLTGQNVEPLRGLKLTLPGSGQERSA